MIAGYIRVSSRTQNHAMQRSAIVKTAAPSRVGRWYEDVWTGGTMDRPGFRLLLEDARAGLFDRLLVFHVDRLTRTGVADTFATLSALRAAGVTVSTIAEPRIVVSPKTSDVVSNVLVFALGLAAELELTNRRERIAAAREHADTWGRPLRMTAAEIVTARRLKDKGRTYAQIAQAVRVPKTVVYRTLNKLSATLRG